MSAARPNQGAAKIKKKKSKFTGGTGSVELDMQLEQQRQQQNTAQTPEKKQSQNISAKGSKSASFKKSSVDDKLQISECYAGASFCNSPAASSLPIPVFAKKPSNMDSSHPPTTSSSLPVSLRAINSNP